MDTEVIDLTREEDEVATENHFPSVLDLLPQVPAQLPRVFRRRPRFRCLNPGRSRSPNCSQQVVHHPRFRYFSPRRSRSPNFFQHNVSHPSFHPFSRDLSRNTPRRYYSPRQRSDSPRVSAPYSRRQHPCRRTSPRNRTHYSFSTSSAHNLNARLEGERNEYFEHSRDYNQSFCHSFGLASPTEGQVIQVPPPLYQHRELTMNPQEEPNGPDLGILDHTMALTSPSYFAPHFESNQPEVIFSKFGANMNLSNLTWDMTDECTQAMCSEYGECRVVSCTPSDNQGFHSACIHFRSRAQARKAVAALHSKCLDGDDSVPFEAHIEVTTL